MRHPCEPITSLRAKRGDEVQAPSKIVYDPEHRLRQQKIEPAQSVAGLPIAGAAAGSSAPPPPPRPWIGVPHSGQRSLFSPYSRYSQFGQRGSSTRTAIFSPHPLHAPSSPTA